MNNISFEEMSNEIDALLTRFRFKWHLTQLSWMSYDDISQIIRLHLYKKWHLWDQSRPFGPWCGRIINHQILNLIRNNYGNYARPCLRCPHYGGNETCGFTKTVVTYFNCDDFAKWEKKKKVAYHIKLPDSIDSLESYQEPSDKSYKIDYDKAQVLLNVRMKKALTPIEWKVYKLLYILNHTDNEVAAEMNYKADPDLCKGELKYKQISKMKRRFIKVAREVLKSIDVLNNECDK